MTFSSMRAKTQGTTTKKTLLFILKNLEDKVLNVLIYDNN